jgi:hypothetical protein
MFDLHAYVAAEMGGATVRLLQTMEGVRHATALPASSGQTVHVTAEVDASAAEQVLDSLETLGVPAGESEPRILAEFHESVSREPRIPAGAPLTYVPEPPETA